MSIPLPGRSYRCGISEINYEYPVYSPSLLIPVPSIDIGEYEWREHEFLGIRDGMRICVHELVQGDHIFRYTITKHPYGWTRQVYLCKKGEERLFPCDFEPHDRNRD